MTDKEIIKALECCIKPTSDCENCPYYKKEDCFDMAKRDALNLINRQQAEHDEIKNNYRETLTKQVELCDVIEKQQAEIERLERINTDLLKIADTRKKANFSLLVEVAELKKSLRTAKAEAEQKLKEMRGNNEKNTDVI